MIIILKPNPDSTQLENLTQWLKNMDFDTHLSCGKESTIMGLIGDTSKIDIELFKALDIVEDVKRIQEPYRSANRKFHPDDTVVDVCGQKIGGGNFCVMAGPCSVESTEQIFAVAKAVKKSGAHLLRGGAFKPRTSPYAFQGLGGDGIDLLVEVKKRLGIGIVSELMDLSQLELFEHVDVIQIGARNMQNFRLLSESGKTDKPILLKRGRANTIEEFLLSAEYIMSSGNKNVILCERGIRTFETATRNTLDISAVPVLKEKTHLPVVVDPSHGTGYSKYVMPMALAAVAAGADGLMIEVHQEPERALCDGLQSLTPEEFDVIMDNVSRVREAVSPIYGGVL